MMMIVTFAFAIFSWLFCGTAARQLNPPHLTSQSRLTGVLLLLLSEQEHKFSQSPELEEDRANVTWARQTRCGTFSSMSVI